MHRGREIALFAVLVVACSLVLGAILHPYGGGNSLVAAGAASVMLCARGYSWSRKLAFAAIVLLGFGAAQRWYDLLGPAAADVYALEPAATIVGMVYIVFMMTFPLVVLVIFVGRDSSALWTPAERQAKEPPRGQKSSRTGTRTKR